MGIVPTMDIKQIRHGLGLSQPQMAKLLGAALGTYRKWEAYGQKPSGAAKRCIEAIVYMDRLGVLKDFSRTI